MLVNIRGCNGAGKSTIPMSMMDDPNMFVQDLFNSENKKVCSLTVFPRYKWVALGTYFNKTGGLDTLKNNEATKIALYAALDLFPEYDILMEGIMASTILSTYVELFHHIEAMYPIKVLILSLVPPVEIAISRVYERNKGASVKEDLIISKWKTVYKNVKEFEKAGFESIKANPAKVKRSSMLSCFLKTVEKYRG